jgi:hypothetical protein
VIAADAAVDGLRRALATAGIETDDAGDPGPAGRVTVVPASLAGVSLATGGEGAPA